MPTVQALRKVITPPPRSPEREALREAIAKREAAEQHLAEVISALQRADAASTECWRAAKRARADLEDARTHEHHRVVAVALGETDAGASLGEAEAVLAKAESDHAAARKVADALVTEQARAADRVKWARQSVDDAARAVLRASPEVHRLTSDAELARQTLAAAVGRLLALPPGVADAVSRGEPKSAEWLAAVEALARDADAPLPQN